MKAPRLSRGDYVGIVSSSWGGAAEFPHRVERGVRAIERLGFRVKLAPHALDSSGFISASAENRVNDLHRMFADPDVRLIIAAIGGDHSCHLLPLLDFELIRKNPTLFMGYSDITVLNVAIWKETGLVTFNGPALLTDFAEFPEMFDYTRSFFLKTVGDGDPPGVITPSSWWTEEFLDWREKQDLTTVDGLLMDYENMGVFRDIRGLLVGRPMRYTEEQRQQLREVVLERTRKFVFPIVTDMDFGHTAPQFILPIGSRARIDTRSEVFEILESAVE